MAAPDGDAPLVSTLLLSSVLSACQPPASTTATQAPVQVAAASDLTLAFEELGQLFEQRTRRKVSLSFAASGALARQLSQGAPFDVFAAAAPSFVDLAVESGACDAESKARYARGYVAVWSKSRRVELKALSDLQSPAIARIAIANPEHAPYGKAAREALISAGLWRKLESKIVHAENVRHALKFAETGNADAAIVALSLVNTRASGQMLSIDPALHEAIEQTLVVCRRGKNETGGREFATLVRSAEGQAILERYGFGRSDQQAAE